MLKLTGHKGDVRAVAFAPDGRVISGGSDRTVRVWNPASGECLATIKAGNVVYAVAASPDGRTLAWGGRPAPQSTSSFVQTADFTGKPGERYEARTFGSVWTITGGRQLQPVARTIWGISFSTDGRYLAAAVRRPGGGNRSDGAGGFYWPVGAGGGNNPLPGEDIYALAFSPEGHRIAVTRANSVVFLDGPDHRRPATPAGGHAVVDLFGDPVEQEGVSYRFSASWASAVAFVPGRELAAVASNSFIEFVNPVRGAKSTRVKTGCRTIIALAASPDGKTVLAGGRPGAIEVYDTARLVKKATYDFGIGGVHALAFAPDGLTFAAAGDEGLIVCDAGE